MKYRFMNIVACPSCRHFPLELYVVEEKGYPSRLPQIEELLRSVRLPLCDLYCYRLLTPVGRRIDEGVATPCDKCLMFEVAVGVIYCPNCGRWYPIIDEIPRLLPDDLRRKSEDLEFLRRYADRLPSKVVFEGRPWNLADGV